MIARIAVALLLSVSSAGWAMAGDAPAASPHFGVARASGDDVCAAIDASGLRSGERVAVVFPTSPQQLSRATLEAVDAESQCTTLRGEDLAGQLFLLRFDPPLPTEDGIGIVVRGTRRFARQRGRWVARLPRGEAWFGSCTSSEGLHLAAWPTPRQLGTPLWHAYVYLGYDTESDCQDAQTRDPPQ